METKEFRMLIMQNDGGIRKIRMYMTGVAILVELIPWMIFPSDASSFAYHATTKAAARHIMKKGIVPRYFHSHARFGKKFYMSSRPKTALAESGKRSKLLQIRTSKYLDRNALDLRKPGLRKLRSYIGNMDLRGTFKNGIIGPKLGHRIGKLADRHGMVIKYRSVKTGGTNIAVPSSVITKHPRSLYQKIIYSK
jgi:hypothetical protein